MRRSLLGSLIAFIVIAAAALGGVVATGTTPQLGLDLQGGASVVLQPRTKVDPEVLDQAIAIIRNRVDALGVAEPDIARQGESIIVQLPGVKDTDQALSVVGQTAQLLFRPVLQALPAIPPEVDPAEATTTTVAGNPATPDLNATTKPEEDDPTKSVVLPERDDKGKVTGRYLLGPAEVKGEALSSARASLNPASGAWAIEFELTSEGTTQWDAMAL
ncbi:MAG: preprotein translocase subunit SecD, partial [Pseudonocardiaceae bacterium]